MRPLWAGEPPWWRPLARRRWRQREKRTAFRRWLHDSWEWQQRNPDESAFEIEIRRDGVTRRVNGPRPPGW